MQLLGVPPRPMAPVFPQVFDHQTHILQMPDAGIRMPKPKTFRIPSHKFHRSLGQLSRRWGWWREVV